MLRSRYFQSYAFWHWGEGLQTVLFTWYMTFHANLSASEIGFYQALVLSPFLIFAIAGGALSDRIGPGRSYVVSTAVFAAVLICYGAVDHHVGFVPELFFLYCVAAGILSAISNPAIDTFIPGATPLSAQQNSLLAANAHNIAKLCGTLTGLLLPVVLAVGGFGLNGGLMALSVVFLILFLRASPVGRGPAPRNQDGVRGRTLRRLVHHYRDCPQNFDILLSSAMLGLLLVPAGYILWPLILRERFPEHGDLIALINVSSWIGAITCTALARRYLGTTRRPGQVSLLVWFAYALLLAALCLVGSFVAMCLIVMLMGGVKLGKAMVYGHYLENSPVPDRALLISVDQTAFWGLATLGTFGMGRMVDVIGLEPTILCTAGAILICLLGLSGRGRLPRLTMA
ncbi:MFS transporter [Rhodobacteraceae bacterium M382]|nr:MFS transporter [Rhodobacteraceae bacterium M382]